MRKNIFVFLRREVCERAWEAEGEGRGSFME